MGSDAPKLPMGAGDGTVHSSVVARHGLRSSVFSPRQRLQTKLERKRPCAATVRIVATVTSVRSDPSNDWPTVLASDVPRVSIAVGPLLAGRKWAARPSQCMGMKTQ